MVTVESALPASSLASIFEYRLSTVKPEKAALTAKGDLRDCSVQAKLRRLTDSLAFK
jgi:hypothetical protein